MPGRTIGDARKRLQPEPAMYSQADLDAAYLAGFDAGSHHRLAPPTTEQLVMWEKAANEAAAKKREDELRRRWA